MGQGLSKDININVKADGLNELKSQFNSLIDSLLQNDVEIPIEFSEVETEKEYKEAIDNLQKLADDYGIKIDGTMDVSKNIDAMKQIKDYADNLNDTVNNITVPDSLIADLKSITDYNPSIKLSGEYEAFYNQLLSIKEIAGDITEKLGNVKTEGDITTLISATESLKTSFADARNLYNSAINDFAKANMGFVSNLKTVKNNLDNLEREFTDLIGLEPGIKELFESFRPKIDQAKNTQELKDLNEAINATRAALKDVKDDYIEADAEQEKLNKSTKDYINNLKEMQEYKESVSKLEKEFENLSNKMDKLGDPRNSNNYKKRLNNISDSFDDFYKKVDEFKEHYKDLGLSDEFIQKIEKSKDSLKNLKDGVKSLEDESSKQKGLTNIAKELNILSIKIPGTNKSLGTLARLMKSGGFEAVALTSGILAVVMILGKYIEWLNKAADSTKKFVSALGSKTWNLITSSFKNLINGLRSGIDTIGQMFSQITNYIINSADLSNIAGVATSLGDDMVNALKGDVQESSLLYQIMTENQRKALLGLENETQRYNYLVSQSGSLQAQYAAYLNTTNGRLLSMKSAFSGVSQTITAFARNVLAVLAPVLTTIANFVNGILQVLGRLLHFDMSGASKIGSIGGSLSDGFNQAKKAAEDYQKSASKSTKKASKDISKAIEEAKRQTLSFDDVIQISDTNKNVSDIDVLDDLDDLDLDNIAGGIGDVADALADLGGSLDLPGMELPQWLQDLLDLLNNKEFFKFGAGLADALADILRKVPWDEIREKAESLGKGLAEFFNGLFSSKSNWETFGYSLAQVFNTIASALQGFLDEFNFKQAGTSIGAFFAKMFDSVDTETIGHNIYKTISGAFEFAVNFLAENPVFKGLNMIAKIISQAFSEWTDEDTQNVANSLVMFIQQALNGITNIIDSIDFSVINNIVTAFFENMQAYLDDTGKGDIKRLLDTVVNGISELLGDGDLANRIIEIANTVLDTLIEWLNNGGDEKLSKIGDAIVSFLDKLRESGIVQKIGDIVRRILGDIQLSSILQEVLGLQFDIWLEGIKTKIDIWFGTLFGGTKEHLQQLWTLLEALWTAGAVLLAYWLIGVENDIKTWWTGFTGKAKSVFDTFKTSILQSIENIVKGISSKVKNGLESVYNVIKSIWDKIKGIFDNITSGIQKVKEEWNNSKIGQMANSIKIPWLNKATGGITNGPSIGLVGEAGREAILPLENNTGWMDILANKIYGLNGGGGNTQNITIDFSSLNKPFYSRAELIEMGQVINDSLNAYNFGTT